MARGEPLIRQWNLLKALQAHRFGICAGDLAERLHCSRRQVQRDLRVLEEVGFPVEYEDRDYGKRFWKLSPHFIESHDLVLSVTEMLSLYLSKQLVSPLAGTQLGDGFDALFDKIKAMLPKKALTYFRDFEERLLAKSFSHQDYSKHQKEIRIISRAIDERRIVELTYKSLSKNGPYDTLFHPYGLILLGGSLYCVGHMAMYGEVRTLKVTRILGIELTDRNFERPEDFSLKTYTRGSFGIFSSGKTQVIKVKFTGWAATNVREQQWHDSQKILKDTAKHVIAQFELGDHREFMRWVLGFGRHAVILEPQSIMTQVRKELELARKQYV